MLPPAGLRYSGPAVGRCTLAALTTAVVSQMVQAIENRRMHAIVRLKDRYGGERGEEKADW